MVTGLRRRRPTVSPDEDTVEVPCQTCKSPVKMTRDRLREMVDAGESPSCGRGPRLCQEGNVARPDSASTSTLPLANKYKVLLTLHRLATMYPGGVNKFDLVVEVWTADKQAFGLKGYETAYPNSNAVIVCLQHLKDNELVHQTGPSLYLPTEKGVWQANQIIKSRDSITKETVRG